MPNGLSKKAAYNARGSYPVSVGNMITVPVSASIAKTGHKRRKQTLAKLMPIKLEENLSPTKSSSASATASAAASAAAAAAAAATTNAAEELLSIQLVNVGANANNSSTNSNTIALTTANVLSAKTIKLENIEN
uniref:Uncharacterized protein n=1 Tax=Glossina pallidipes TaxID=7398 RepID=A0A1A9ZWX1_GLOPL